MGFLTGKTAIITGGGRAVLSNGECGSIGYGIATAYAKEGANLVLTGRNVQKLTDAKEELEAKYGIKVLPVQADVSAGSDNEAIVQNVVKQAIDTFGRIDVLINNAQASASGVTIADHTTEQFDLAVYSGLYAAFYYMKACYPYLKETKGSVINFASGAGLFGNFGQCAYAAAKEGIRGLTRVAATEWGPDGINVNVVCPLAWTAQMEKFEQAYPDAFKANVKMPPMGHYGDVEKEIGRVCVQLASPDFKYMRGMDTAAQTEPRETYRVSSHSAANSPHAIRATRQFSSHTSVPPDRMPLPPLKPKNTGNIWPSSQPRPPSRTPSAQSPNRWLNMAPPSRQATTVLPMSNRITPSAYLAP